MQQRYYDPVIGRFLSVDPVTTNPNTGAMFNRYNYANNNPYRFVDPDGREAGAAYSVMYRADSGESMAAPEAGELGSVVVDVVVSAAIDIALGGPSGEGLAIFTGIRAARAADKAADAGKGVAAANRAESRAKGIPDSQIGPSGKPKVHTVEHSTRKGAKESAQRETPQGGRVRNDASPQDGQKPHFQAENAKGENVKPVVHHCKPDKAC